MSYQSQKEEDIVFNSLSEVQKSQYFYYYSSNGGNAEAALDAVVGKVWFDSCGNPKGGQ